MSSNARNVFLLMMLVPVSLFLGSTTALAQKTAKPVLHGSHWVAVTGKPLAATAGNSNLLNPMRTFLQKVHRGMCDDGLPVEHAWLILAVLDGMKFWRALDLLEPSEPEWAGIRSILEQLIDSGEPL